MRACVRACIRACVCVCARARVRMCRHLSATRVKEIAKKADRLIVIDPLSPSEENQTTKKTEQNGAGIAQLVVLGLAVHSVAGSILLWGHFR